MNATTEDKAGQASPPWVLTRVPLDADWLAAMAAHYHVIPWRRQTPPPVFARARRGDERLDGLER